MERARDHAFNEFGSLHTGKANPGMVESLSVEAYGTQMKLLEVAAVTTPDPRSIRIEPWDKSILKSVEKAIQQANLGLNPVVDGHVVRCPIPELSTERRKELVKIAGTQAEDTRVGVRAARREALDTFKKMQKDSQITEDDLKDLEKQVQKMTDDTIKEVNDALKEKESELMSVNK